MINRGIAWTAVVGFLAAGCAPQSGGEDSTEIGKSSAALSEPVMLIAVGTLSGNQSDRSAKTAGVLENGTEGNLFGGIGSGLAYAGGNTFLAVPDRGPNAMPYNDLVDDTTSYIDRFHTLGLDLRRNANSTGLPFSLTPRLHKTTLFFERAPLVYGDGAAAGIGSGVPALNRRHVHYFTGRSDNFDPSQLSTSPDNARFDPESIRVSRDGRHVYVSDEYGPYVYQFERATGRRTRAFTLPDEFAVATLSSQGDVEISDNTAGRLANKGMEGLAITPDGSALIGSMQSPLIQDGGKGASVIRIAVIDITSGAVSQYAYMLTNIGSSSKPKYPTVSDIVAINDHELLVDERDGNGLGDDSTAKYKMLYKIDLAGAEEISGLEGESNLAPHAVAKAPFLDLVAALNAYGIASEDIPSKIEGLAFGPDVRLGGQRLHTLFISNDNDFIGTVVDGNHPNGIDNPNTFFVFGIDPAALPGFEAQKLPGSHYR